MNMQVDYILGNFVPGLQSSAIYTGLHILEPAIELNVELSCRVMIATARNVLAQVINVNSKQRDCRDNCYGN